MPKNILVGPSTVYGHNAMDGGSIGFADHVKVVAASARLLYPEDQILDSLKVYNKGEPGETIDTTVNRVARELDSFGPRIGSTLITAMLGTYDHAERFGIGPMTSEVSFQAELGRLRDICIRYDVKLTLLGSPPIDGLQTIKGFANGQSVEDIFDYDSRRKYEDIQRDFAERNGIPFREVHDSLGGVNVRSAGFVSYDNVHLNAAGHDILTYHALVIAQEQLDLPDLTRFIPNVDESESGLVVIRHLSK